MFLGKHWLWKTVRGVALSRPAGKRGWVNIHQWLGHDKKGKGFLKTRPEYLSFCRLSLSTLISLPSPSSSPLFTALLSSKDSRLSSRASVSFLITSPSSTIPRNLRLAHMPSVSCHVIQNGRASCDCIECVKRRWVHDYPSRSALLDPAGRPLRGCSARAPAFQLRNCRVALLKMQKDAFLEKKAITRKS